VGPASRHRDGRRGLTLRGAGLARLLGSSCAAWLAVVRAVVVPVMVLVVMVVVALVMAVVTGGIVGPVARLGDAGSADGDRPGDAEQCDCA
jgi:hypothetical protein